MREQFEDVLVRLLGRHAGILHGDPCTFDRWRWVRARLDERRGRLLDAGSGSGGFSLYAAAQGTQVVGITFEADANTKARRRAELLGVTGRAEFVDGDLRDLNRIAPRLGRFRQILCLETVEHLADDRGLLETLAALLEPGGRLLLTTPHDRHRRLVTESVSSVEDGGHIRWGYSEEELRDIVEAAGLEVVEVGWISGAVSQQLTNLMRLLNGVYPRLGWLVTLPLRPLQALDRPMTRLTGYPWLCVGIVAVKPG